MISPWIHQLNRTRPPEELSDNAASDVVVIGAGIAGVTTAYYLLKNTTHRVFLIEAGKVAHGATGHNAGQIASYFERTFADMADEFGLELAARGQESIDNTWILLEEILRDTTIQVPLWPVTGYAGISSTELLMTYLEDTYLKHTAGIQAEDLLIADTVDLTTVPEKYHGHYTVLPLQDIQSLLNTNDPDYIAALRGRKGCLNSALFCEELVQWMLENFADRLRLAEHSPVQLVQCNADGVIVHANGFVIQAQYAVLCTNGFEHFAIESESNPTLNKQFHSMIHGTIGYMAAYLDEQDEPPTAMSYLELVESVHSRDSEPPAYIYLTRRPFELEPDKKHNLICIGGPEEYLEDHREYSPDMAYRDLSTKEITDFLHETVKDAPVDPKYVYQWHGLMGYTRNNMRRVGPEPTEPRLLYNLGCNGVGILPSIFGGHRIARYLNNETVEPSMFDVPRQNDAV